MEIITRKPVREFLCALIRSNVDVVSVLPYQVVTFEGQSPLIYITSTGSSRTGFRPRVGVDTTMRLAVHVFVLHGDGTDNWTTQDAEDLLDELEAGVARSLVNNQITQYWNSIEYEAPSMIERVAIEGTPYLYELIPLVAEAK